MINIENQIFDGLTKALQLYDNKIRTSSVFTNTPSSYPFVSIEEIENSDYEQGITGCQIDNFANVSYEVVVFIKNQDFKKTNANKIANEVDTYMHDKGFVREMKYTRQDDNETEYRIYLRYSAVVSKSQEIYRR